MKRLRKHCGKSFWGTVAILSVFFLFTCRAAAMNDYFRIQSPPGWHDRRDHPGNDLKQQVMAPGNDAFIEVYAVQDGNIGIRGIADRLESSMRSKGKTFLGPRQSSKRVHVDNNPGIIREYSGDYNDTPLRAVALYTYGSGHAFAVFGVYAQNQTARYRNMIYTSVTSLRFSKGSLPESGPHHPPGDISGAADGTHGPESGVCCSYYGLWDFVSRGTRIHLMPNHLYDQYDKDRGSGGLHRFHWQCRGDRVTVYWPDGAVKAWQRQDTNLMTRTNEWGGIDKAVRLKDFFVMDGQTYTACPDPGIDIPDQVPDIPRTNRARKITGNMGCTWGLAQGTLKSGETSQWELAATKKVCLKFKGPDKKGEQRYFVRVFFADGELAAQTRVGLSGTLALGPGSYTIEVTTDLRFVRWRCQWK